MLSNQYDMGEFVEKVRGCSFEDVIFLTDKEATEAERYLYRECRDDSCEAARQYVVSLKDFIQYVRYGLVTRSTRDLDLTDFKEAFR